MNAKFIINALILSAIWLIPILFISTMVDQLIPEIKEDESTIYTVSMIVFQIVVFLMLFELFKIIIIHVNKKIFKGFKSPEVINGVIILGIIKGATQHTLDKRFKILYDKFDKKLEKIGIY